MDIREAWEEAGPLIAAALEGFEDSPIDVLLDCIEGRSFFFASERSFSVIRPVLSDMLILVAVSRGAQDCIAAELSEIKAVAKGMGGKRAVFHTKRPGFERKMPQDWSIHHVVWATEL